MLAGGQGTRLGGGDKPALIVGQRSLVASVVRAARAAGARRVVVVGPPRPWLEPGAGDLRAVREDPPGGGPVAGLRRGLAEVSALWVAVLAADLPFLAGEHLAALLAAGAAASGAVLADESGRAQWLAGCWQTVLLRQAIGGYQGSSMRGLLAPLEPALLELAPGAGEPPPWLDCDTPQDLRRARAWCSTAGTGAAETGAAGEGREGEGPG